MSSQTPLPSVFTRTVPRLAPDGMGKGLFASTDIKTGEDVVYIKVPFVAVLDKPRLDDTCSGCFGKKQLESETDLKACTGCRVVKYCDRACQSKDWKFAHSLECPIFQKVKPMVLPNNARAILRMVLRTGRNKYSTQELDVFSGLETHMQQIEQSQAQLDRVTLTARAIKNYSETDMNEVSIAEYAAKLDLNSFNLTTALYDRIGLYLHPYAALINHSCNFNSTVGFDGEELFVKAVRPIKKDEQIFISYIDTTTPHEIRRTELSERYFFDCRCTRCAKGTDTPEDRFSGTPEDTSVLETAERKALELMQSASASETKPEESIAELESALHILHKTGVWPLTRQPYASLRDQLIVSLLSAGNFGRAFIQAAIRYLRVDPALYSSAHPIRHMHAWILVKLSIYASQSLDPNSKESAFLQKFEINFYFILWYILADLASKQMESCTVPSFKNLVGSHFAQVHNEFKVYGVDPSTSRPLFAAEWKKLERLVSLALEKE
ncbi:hypothetical protein NUU61_002916 [Penicillium alfredii]|uniref:Suppressor of anucleate metulae protein B n=1 Tax=Penicillium alfredii TaxID=1506179 RepID=A0A9W9KGD6_9EURO|nr:uncharacterized protein NUU61_002916 [Penicillium alfredii]KAJ5105569.1 hypothetical protein NUU61_002916 [Penicillium alfredii]